MLTVRWKLEPPESGGAEEGGAATVAMPAARRRAVPALARTLPDGFDEAIIARADEAEVANRTAFEAVFLATSEEIILEMVFEEGGRRRAASRGEAKSVRRSASCPSKL
jgi:hypothetical protein